MQKTARTRSTSSSAVNGSPLDFCLHRHPVSVNCLYHAQMFLSVEKSFTYFARNARCTVTTDLLVWYSNTQNNFSPGAFNLLLHTIASPSGRNVNYDEKQLTGKKVWAFPSICTGFVNICPFFLWRCDPTLVMTSSFLRFSRSHTMTHHIRQDSSGRVISSSQKPLPDNTQNSQQTNIHAPCGIRTHDLSRRAAADLRLRPHGHWYRQYLSYGFPILNFSNPGVHYVKYNNIW